MSKLCFHSQWQGNSVFAIIVMLCCGRVLTSSVYRYSVTNPAASQDNYIHSTIPGFPALDMTICAWVKIPSTQSSTFLPMFSVAIESGLTDQLMITFEETPSQAEYTLWVYHYYGSQPRLKTASNNTVQAGTWSFICLVCKYLGFGAVTADPEYNDWLLTLSLTSEDRYGTWEWSGEYPYYTGVDLIGADREASLVIFNDQDSYGGDLDPAQSTVGEMMCLNIWNASFTTGELLKFAGCRSVGDVLTWGTSATTLHGAAFGEWITPDFIPGCRVLTSGIYRYSVSNPAASDDNYISHIIPAFPSLDTTICAWVKIPSTQSSSFLPMLTIAIKSGLIDHIQISFEETPSQTEYTLWVYHYYGSQPRLKTASNNTVQAGTWSFICLVCKYMEPNAATPGDHDWLLTLSLMSEDRYGTWEWSGEFPYTTGADPFGADREASLVIFNEQDSYGGDLDPAQSTLGEMMCLNIWRDSYTMDVLLNFADCMVEGDVFAWGTSTTTLHGAADGEWIIPEFIPTPAGAKDRLDHRILPRLASDKLSSVSFGFYTGSDRFGALVQDGHGKSAALFRTFHGTKMTGLEAGIQNGTTLNGCVKKCLHSTDCYSVNYGSTTPTCELGNLVQSLEVLNMASLTGWKHLSLVIPAE